MSRRLTWSLPAFIALAACDVTPRTEEVGDANPPPSSADDDDAPEPDASDAAGSTGGEDEGTSGDAEVGSTGISFDVPQLPEPVEPGVCDAVDLLFVIDNSGSMADEQANLIASVPGFIDGISDRLGVSTDYHVGVVSTDEATFNGDGCQQLGALVTKTGGDLSSDAECGPYIDGTHFITPRDDLEGAFSCAARLGIDGNGLERPNGCDAHRPASERRTHGLQRWLPPG